jgi:hypothetical protein
MAEAEMALQEVESRLAAGAARGGGQGGVTLWGGGALQEVESRLAAGDGAAPREYSTAHITHALRARPRPRVSLLAQVLSLLALLVQKHRY